MEEACQAHLVLVHERGQHGEGGAGLSHNGNGDGRAHAVLALLHLQVIQQGDQDVLRPDRLGNVAEGVDGRAADALLVRLEHLQQLKADAHPLARRHKLRASVRNAPHQVDAILLHLRRTTAGGRACLIGDIIPKAILSLRVHVFNCAMPHIVCNNIQASNEQQSSTQQRTCQRADTQGSTRLSRGCREDQTPLPSRACSSKWG